MEFFSYIKCTLDPEDRLCVRHDQEGFVQGRRQQGHRQGPARQVPPRPDCYHEV